jgi:SAM-dependent methyltransferase
VSFKNIFYPESKFGGFTDIDGTIAFYARVNSLITEKSVLVDFGCGRGEYSEDPVLVRRHLRIFKTRVKCVIGLDIDPVGESNPFIDEFHYLTSDKWPLQDASVDVIVCDSVIEHLSDPEVFFSESKRVLRKDGYLCLRTPNFWSYVILISRLIPNRFHAKVVEVVQEGRKAEDVFPTYYRCNTIQKTRKLFKKYGFEGTAYGYEAEPSYLSFSVIFYWFGVVYQRLAPRFLSSTIFGFAKRC